MAKGKRKYDDISRIKTDDFNGEIGGQELKVINDYDKLLFAHNALMQYDFQNATKAVMTEFDLSHDKAKKWLTLAKEARSVVNANKGTIEEQINEAVDKFEYHRQKAIELRDMKAANQALVEIGKLKQLYVNRVEIEVTTKTFNLNWGAANVQDAVYTEVTPPQITEAETEPNEQLPF